MPKRIQEDHQDFENVIDGRLRKELGRLGSTGRIFKLRGKNGKVSIVIRKIDEPYFVHGSSSGGIGRGAGNKGDVVGRDPVKGKGNGAGQGEGEGMVVNVDLDDVLAFLQDELMLPNLKPKPNQTFEDKKIKYNDIALNGPESLRHNRRTMQQALKRSCAMGQLDKLTILPGYADPMRMITPTNSDRRYRQYKELKIPSSNAVIFYARDWSASMDNYKCEIISDMCWWMDCFIRRFYQRVERCYIGHDSIAEECSEDKFYKYRHGGGTNCSSAVKLIGKQFENRFPSDMWNIYVFYFTDGENWSDDNEIFVNTLRDQFGPTVVNLVGVTQIQSYRIEDSVKMAVDNAIASGKLNSEIIRTTQIRAAVDTINDANYGVAGKMSEEQRAEQIKKAIQHLLGATKIKK